MTNRRTFLRDTSISCGLLLCGCSTNYHQSGMKGCYAAAVSGSFAQGSLRFTRSSGSEQIDSVLARESERLTKSFAVRPTFSYFIEPNDMGPNALATSERLLSQMGDGTVLLGLRFIEMQRKPNRVENPLLPLHLRVVLAHEYAHIFQLRLNVWQLPTPYRELQADFLAGWHLSPSFPDKEVEMMAGFVLWRGGDLAFNNPDHHGTHSQRMVMLAEGSAFRKEHPSANAIQASERAISHIFPRNSRILVRASRQWFEGDHDLIIGDD